MRSHTFVILLVLITLVNLWFIFTTYNKEVTPTTSIVSPKNTACPWMFEAYKSSPWEQTWIEHIAQWGAAPCKRYNISDFDKYADTWVNYSTNYQNFHPTSPPDKTIFSTFVEKNACTGELKYTYIEPLALLTRHPYVCKDFKTYLLDKNYLYIDWNIGEKVRDSGGKVYYFDLGASSWNSGAGGPSQPWIAEKLEQRGLSIDGIWAWEAQPHPAEQIFQEIPGRYWGNYHWYNFRATTEVGDYSNPLTIIKEIALQSDFVVFKMDIDIPKLETAFMQQILQDPSISSLIDVMFYEFHNDAEEYRPLWFKGKFNDTMMDLFDAFLKGRQLGIELHSWV